MSTAAPFSPSFPVPLSPLRVGVDALNLLHDQRGIGRYARALLSRWAVMSDRLALTLLIPHRFPRLVERRLSAAIGAQLAVRRRAEAARLGLHVVWYPWSGMTWVSGVTSVATVHDVWPFAAPAEDERKRNTEQTPFRRTADLAAAIITDSAFSKSEIVRYLKVQPDRVTVIPLGVDVPKSSDAKRVALNGAQRYVLFVGEAEERKDVATLLRAMQQLPDELRLTTGVVMVGKPPPPQRRVGRLRTQPERFTLDFEPRSGVLTVATGTIHDDALAALYHGATAFVFPSRYEGFGLPVLEAMAHGVPVIASDAASVPEVAGDAALFFPTGKADELAAQIERLLKDEPLRQRLQTCGYTRARECSWDVCADRTLAVLASTVAEAAR